jgi:hypothetical protein
VRFDDAYTREVVEFDTNATPNGALDTVDHVKRLSKNVTCRAVLS